MALAQLVLTLAVLARPPLQISANARAFQPGELIVVTIADAGPAERLRVRAFGREWPLFAVDREPASALVGIDLDVAPGRYVIDVGTGDPPASQATYPLT